jgi:hypothetical protein
LDVSLEPHIGGAASVLTERGKTLQTLPMDDRKMGHDVRLGHPEVDGGADAALRVGFEGAVMGQAAAIGARMKSNTGFVSRIGSPDIGALGIFLPLRFVTVLVQQLAQKITIRSFLDVWESLGHQSGLDFFPA